MATKKVAAEKPAEKKEAPKKEFKPYHVIVNTGALNVRSGPSMEASVVKVVSKGTNLHILATENAWGQIVDGWVNLKFTVKE